MLKQQSCKLTSAAI